MHVRKASLLVLSTVCCPVQLAAQDLFGPENLEANIDFRASVTDGEESWLDGGFGKLREGGDNGDTAVRARMASADIAWKPDFTWNFSGLVSVTYQEQLKDEPDLNEAFLKFRSGPAATQFSARAGLFWPPISQEHEGASWLVADTITPSAVNSWVGEEVKVLGLEGTVEHAFGEHELSATGAVFLHDDMAGTILFYRGWALHDVRISLNGDLPLPPLSAYNAPYQAPITTPFLEVDDRVGFYGRVDWTPTWPVTFNAFYYDNRGDRLSTYEMQTSWRTRFWNVGAMASLGPSTVAKAQLMWGNTLVGPDTPWGIPGDVDFWATYLLVTQEIGQGKLSVRADWFETNDNSFVVDDNNDEYGWAATLAYKHQVATFADVLFEVLHVSSYRPSRLTNGWIDPDQAQTTFQSSIRFKL